jgi:hypothetical protein
MKITVNRSTPMAKQPSVDQSLLIIEISRSHSDAPYSEGLLWKSDQPDAEIFKSQYTTLKTDIRASGWIRTRNPSKRAAADSLISPKQRPQHHNTQHLRQTSMPPDRFEPAIPTSERPQTYALDRAAIQICQFFVFTNH